MSRISELSNDATVYLVLNEVHHTASVNAAAEEVDREAVIRNFIGGQYSNGLRDVWGAA
jgi:hypothetical protein